MRISALLTPTGPKQWQVRALHPICLHKWVYARSFQIFAEREELLQPWLRYYNFHGPHASLNFKRQPYRASMNPNNFMTLHTQVQTKVQLLSSYAPSRTYGFREFRRIVCTSMILVILALCHGRGRGFEPVVPARFKKDLSPIWHVTSRYKKVQIRNPVPIDRAPQQIRFQVETFAFSHLTAACPTSLLTVHDRRLTLHFRGRRHLISRL